MKRVQVFLIPMRIYFLSILLIGLVACSQNNNSSQGKIDPYAPLWHAQNERLIEEFDVTVRNRNDIPDNNIQSNLGDGKVVNITKIPSIKLADGVWTKAYWGTGNLMSFINLEPNAEIPKSYVLGERFTFVMRGEIEELIDGEYATLTALEREAPTGVSGAMPKKEFVYLEDGASTAIRTGDSGARILNIYAPIPSGYLEKAGAFVTESELEIHEFQLPPSVEPNRIYDLYDFQYTELVPGVNARLISGKATQMSFLRMAPDIDIAYHNHPEEQVMIGLRGWIDEYILADTVRMKTGDMINLPAQYVHGGKLGPHGSDALDVFYPPRADYREMMEAEVEEYHAIIPEDSEVELIVDGSAAGPGLNFTEGPAWLNGKLYFSNMYFDADYTGDPARSAIVEMDPDGSYRYINDGQMQTNGIIPAENGNMIVADMFGGRVIEMDTSGEALDVLADSYDNTPIDGPNDLVLDEDGGFYFTDPQFTPEEEKHQPGRSVYYRDPEGEVIQVVPYNDFAMPNGVVLSPDGKTIYINNTYDSESWWDVDSDKNHFVWAYDVNDDGKLGNGRAFAELHLTGEVLDRRSRSSGADGMTVDQNGNLYVATYAGLQIFDADGEFIGMVNMPTIPVNVTFGGEDMQTLYITSYDRIYSIRTNVIGHQLPNSLL